jgi:hypothetical protein
MHLDVILSVLATATALAAAARSTWSPCGLSMLSSLTPFGERSRGHRYGVTAAWFVVGSTAGGATLGLAAFAVTAGASSAGALSHPAAIALFAGASALLGAAVDARVFGNVLPVVRRQVDDRWLSRYRGWVYASGFGWQIGTGVTTYVMTSAVFVFLALAVLSAHPWAALAICAGFGAARGGAILLTTRAQDPQELRVLHKKLERAGEPVRRVAIVVQATTAVIAISYVQPVLGLVCAAIVVVSLRILRDPATAGVGGK